jgi:hypothetical protein
MPPLTSLRGVSARRMVDGTLMVLGMERDQLKWKQKRSSPGREIHECKLHPALFLHGNRRSSGRRGERLVVLRTARP